MKIDTSRLNLTERDLEDYLWANPNLIKFKWGDNYQVDRWLARQLRVPSGIIDLFGITNRKKPVVVELKIGPIDAKALAQVARYAHNIESVFCWRDTGGREIVPIKVVVGSSCDPQSMNEAIAMQTQVILFAPKFEIDFSQHGYAREGAEAWENFICELSQREDLFSAFDPKRPALDDELANILAQAEQAREGGG